MASTKNRLWLLPEFHQTHTYLGRLYAFLSRKEDAIRESRRAVELESAMDASLACNLAMVYARTGEEGEALTLIERLLTMPGAVRVRVNADFGITLSDLRYRWEWDPLGKNPRFQKIVANPEPKTIF